MKADELHPSAFILHPLVDLGQQLSADVLATGGLAAHQALRSRDNVHAVPAQHLGDLARTDINAPARPRDPLQVRDGRGAARVVTQKNADGSLQPFALYDEVVDVALFFKDPGDLEFQLRSRNIYA